MFDAIVVGTGPAGSLTAHQLGKWGHSVCLLEKESLPRYKPCGGGLPHHAVDLLRECGVSIDEYIEYVAERVNFMFDFTEPVSSDLSDSPVTMVNRADFDYGLVRQAMDKGVELRDETRVDNVEINPNACEVELGSGNVLRAKFVVGADGAGSQVARSLDLRGNNEYGVALDAEVQVPEEIYEAESAHATFNINFVNHGYGWIFPKDKYLALGVGGYEAHHSYNDLITDYVNQSIGSDAVNTMDIYGHPLPFFKESRQIVDRRVGLVGDAANMVDSLSGEGIFYALKSGKLIAECIDESIRTGSEDLHSYQSRVENSVFKELIWSSRLAKIFFAFPRKCYEHGVKSPRIVEWIKQVVVSQSSYDEIYSQLWQEIKSIMGKKLLTVPGLFATS